MLYNPHTRLCSRESILYYLDTKDPKGRYSWTNPVSCACGQYINDVCNYVTTHNWGPYIDNPNILALNKLAMPPNNGDWGTWGDLRDKVILRKDLFI